MDEQAQLIEGARTLGVALEGEAAARLSTLLDELTRWNRSYNLTAIVERERMVTHHLMDSLSIYGDLQGDRVADVGSGAGFPGLPLAIVDPRRHYTLIDSNNKKVRFIAHITRSFPLVNVTPLHARVESLTPQEPFDTIVVRAFAALPVLLEQVSPICGPHTRVLAMKGKRPLDELAALGKQWQALEIRDIQVPGLAEARTPGRSDKT